MQRTDMQVHTCYSHDGYISLRSLDAACVQRGLTAVAITDHNEIRGAQRAAALYESGILRTRIIVGEEINTTEGEVIGLFLRQFVPPNLTLAQTTAAIHAQGGLVYLNHPFGYGRRSAQLDFAALAEIWDEIDIVEIFNGRNWRQCENDMARALAVEHGLPGGVGTDAHSPWEVGRSFVETLEFDGAKEFLEALGSASHHCKPCPATYRLAFKFRKMLFARPLPIECSGEVSPQPCS